MSARADALVCDDERTSRGWSAGERRAENSSWAEAGDVKIPALSSPLDLCEGSLEPSAPTHEAFDSPADEVGPGRQRNGIDAVPSALRLVRGRRGGGEWNDRRL